MNEFDDNNEFFEEVAIIGMAGRFPGARNVDEFWRNLCDGVEARSHFLDEELTVLLPAEVLQAPNYVRAGFVLEDIELFDAAFFEMSPRQAQMTDPQQRLFLETTWQALEHAGVDVSSYEGLIGVYAGSTMSSYYLNKVSQLSSGSLASDLSVWLGNDKDYLTTQTAYKLNLQGPCVNVQTACSTGLVAVHLACQSLLSHESDIALAGGVTVKVPQKSGYLYQENAILSPDGHCRAFDANAQGTVFGNGVGVVVLKRLSEALEDGDNILAVIKGSAINNDGSQKIGFTAPSLDGQAKVIAEAITVARVAPETITYVETHGTGTPIGDPIEIAALTQAFRGSDGGNGSANRGHCAIGALKTNIGHLESAAGIAGLIKSVLALQHKLLPPTLHFETPNPEIDFANSPFYVNTKLTEWPSNQQPRRAGISSFGIGGTNAHVVLEEASNSAARKRAVGEVGEEGAERERPLHLLTLSAKSEAALMALVEQYQAHLTSPPLTPPNSAARKRALGGILNSPSPRGRRASGRGVRAGQVGDICFTANSGRADFTHRLALVASDEAGLHEKLLAVEAAQEASGVFRGQVKPDKQPKVAFLFTGQGSQYVSMGRQLYETQPTFRDALDRCDEICRPYMRRSLVDLLYPRYASGNLLDQTAYTQPALFALEYALAELWQSWGVMPDVVMGHSVGEIVAACVAGVFSLEDGLKFICERGRLMQALPRDGEMVAVKAHEEQVQAAISRSLRGTNRHQVSIAAINSSPAESGGLQDVVISGKGQAVQAVVAALQAEGVKSKKLTVSHAFHSPLMVPMLAEFTRVARGIEYSAPQIKLIANVTGELAGKSSTNNVTNPDYWVRHVRQPVRFADGMKTLYEQGYEIFVELGPKPTLLGMGARSVPEGYGAWLPSLRPFDKLRAPQGHSDWQQLLSSLGQLYVRGVPVDWAAFHQHDASRKVVLPTYPFQRQRYWIDTPPPGESGRGGEGERGRAGEQQSTVPEPVEGHPLLGQEVELPDAEKIRFQARLSPTWPAYLADHRVFEQVVMPATGYVEMALAAARELWPNTGLMVEEFFIQQPLFLSERHQTSIQAVLSHEPDDKYDADGGYAWQLFSKSQAMSKQKSSSKRFPSPKVGRGARGEGWTRHAFGTLRPHQQPQPRATNLAYLRSKCTEKMDMGTFYRSGDRGGVVYGPHFQALTELWRSEDVAEGEALGQVRLPEPLRAQADAYALHPVLLDASLQITASVLPSGLEGVYLPSSVEGLTLFGRGGYSDLWGYARAKNQNQTANSSQIAIDLSLYDARGQVVAELTGVTFRRASQQALLRSPLAEWLYKIAWQAAPLPEPPQLPSTGSGSMVETGNWLIFADQAGIGAKLAALLTAEGQHVRLISAEDCPLDKPLAEAGLFLGPNQPPYRGVVYLRGADRSNVATTSVPETAQAHSTSLLHLVQALVEADNSPSSPRLWLVTQGAQAVVEEPLALSQVPLWGLGRTIMWEHPELEPVCVDLATNQTLEQAAEALFEEVWFADQPSPLAPLPRAEGNRENQVAYREGMRYVARLRSHRARASKPLATMINQERSYLITGGLGGLGLKVAQWLVEQGAGELVLAGRRGAKTEREETIKEAINVLQQTGTNVLVVQADVSQEADVVKLLDAAQKPLGGIIHAAGVLDDGILLQQSAERFEKVMTPKVLGSWHLHQLTETLNMELDFFVCFSSTASLLGAGGQANYAAANAFMDGLMQQRRAMGLPGLSINWGGWSDVGMAADLVPPKRGVTDEPDSGMSAIAPTQGLQLLGDLLGGDAAQVAVIPIESSKLQDSAPGWPLFSAISGENFRSPNVGRGARGEGSSSFLQELERADVTTRQSQLVTYLQQRVSHLLAADSAWQADLDESLMALGLDSLMNIELSNRIKAELAINVPVRKFLEGTSIMELADYINSLITVQALQINLTPLEREDEYDDEYEDEYDDEYEEGRL